MVIVNTLVCRFFYNLHVDIITIAFNHVKCVIEGEEYALNLIISSLTLFLGFDQMIYRQPILHGLRIFFTFCLADIFIIMWKTYCSIKILLANYLMIWWYIFAGLTAEYKEMAQQTRQDAVLGAGVRCKDRKQNVLRLAKNVSIIWFLICLPTINL